MVNMFSPRCVSEEVLFDATHPVKSSLLKGLIVCTSSTLKPLRKSCPCVVELMELACKFERGSMYSVPRYQVEKANHSYNRVFTLETPITHVVVSPV